MLTSAPYTCPYCFQVLEAVVDPSQGASQRYVEDCEVCCRPCTLVVRITDGQPEVDAEPA